MEKKGVRSVRRAITGEEFQAFDDNVCWDSSRVIRGILAEKEREERLYVSVDGRGDGFRPLRDIPCETNEHRYFSYRLGVNPSRNDGYPRHSGRGGIIDDPESQMQTGRPA